MSRPVEVHDRQQARDKAGECHGDQNVSIVTLVQRLTCSLSSEFPFAAGAFSPRLSLSFSLFLSFGG